MAVKLDCRQEPRARLPELRARHGVKRLYLFASRARGAAGAGSDLDLLVGVKRVPTFLDPARLERELADDLGIRVRMVTPGATKPLIRPAVEVRSLNGSKPVRTYREEIYENAEKARRFLGNPERPGALERDELRTCAIVRALEVIGEAAKRVPAEYRTRQRRGGLGNRKGKPARPGFPDRTVAG